MRCIICNGPTTEVFRRGVHNYKGEVFRYWFREQKCKLHPNDSFQTERQISDALESINKIRAAHDAASNPK